MKTADPAARDILTQADAEARALRISKTAYTFALGPDERRARLRRRRRRSSSTARAAGTRSSTSGARDIDALRGQWRRPSTPQWTGYRLTLPCASLAADEHACASSTRTTTTTPATASTSSSTPRTARSTSTRTSSRTRRTGSSPASTSRTSRRPTRSPSPRRPTGR